jgi:ribonuclease E
MSDPSAGDQTAEPFGLLPDPAQTYTPAQEEERHLSRSSAPQADSTQAEAQRDPPSPGSEADEAVSQTASTSSVRRRRRRRRRSSQGGSTSSPRAPEGLTDESTETETDDVRQVQTTGARDDVPTEMTSSAQDGVPDPARGPRIGDTRRQGPRPRIGDTRPAPPPAVPPTPVPTIEIATPRAVSGVVSPSVSPGQEAPEQTGDGKRPGQGEDQGVEGEAWSGGEAAQARAPTRGGRARRRSGRERRGRPVGRYLMCVHVRPHATQIAVLEGRILVEHYVSRASDDTAQIDGNVYRGRVQNVLPGMEAAFIDIGTPKNAVLYRGDVRYDRDDIETSSGSNPRIEQMLKPGQLIVCQVTKNPIGAKGARLTQEVSLPGRFVVMVPNSSAFGISKRLDENERRRLRRIVDDTRPQGHGLIVRTAAEGASREELANDVDRLMAQWAAIEEEAKRSTAPGLLYREPDLAVRIVREEFNREYRGVVIDDFDLFSQVRTYVEQVNPELADRIEYYDPVAENLPIFERFHVHEQLHKALDRKVWLPSGGSLIIERTEALTVIDVNTGKNVGTSNLEETVYRNNLEAAEEIARQLRLRDIGGIIVVDFIDMEIRENRNKVGAALRAALARDKTRTQVFDISELGLVEMTRKRVSEGLVESLSGTCAVCGGRGIVLDESLL